MVFNSINQKTHNIRLYKGCFDFINPSIMGSSIQLQHALRATKAITSKGLPHSSQTGFV